MINYIHGNVLEVTDGYIIHGCNAQGVMGGGIALQIKNKWPHVFNKYREWYLEERVDNLCQLPLGHIQIVTAQKNLKIVNAITQNLYGRDKSSRYASYDAIADCFEKFNDYALKNSINKIRFPLIGAGLANGNWDIISNIIDNTVDDSIIKECYLFAPSKT